MRPLLDDAPVLDHHDPVGVDHGRQPVGDNEGGAVFEQRCQRLLDNSLGLRVDAGSGFVQD